MERHSILQRQKSKTEENEIVNQKGVSEEREEEVAPEIIPKINQESGPLELTDLDVSNSDY